MNKKFDIFFTKFPKKDDRSNAFAEAWFDTFTRMEAICTTEECLAFAKGNIDNYNWHTKGQDLQDFERIIANAEWAIKLIKSKNQ